MAAATLIFGIYLHLSRVIFGDEALMRTLLTLAVDKAAIAAFAGWKQLRFRNRNHRIVRW